MNTIERILKAGLVLLVSIIILIPVTSVFAENENEDDIETVFSLPVVEDFSSLSNDAKQKKVPILLMYSAESCEWCERLEGEVLGPMEFSGEYHDRVIIRKVMIDSAGNVIDFDGNVVEAEAFRFRRGIQVTPTLQIVSADGKELVPQIIGFKTPELFAAYLENALQDSEKILTKNLNRYRNN